VIVTEALVMSEICRVVERELASSRVIKPSDRLVGDLGLDSVTMTTLAVELEDRFHVILTGDEAAQVHTVEELVRFVVRAGNDGGDPQTADPAGAAS
jgi:acyl carrier protein